MIDLTPYKESEKTFINLGAIVAGEIITAKVNKTGKNIDLRNSNVDKRLLINLGEKITADEINEIYNT